MNALVSKSWLMAMAWSLLVGVASARADDCDAVTKTFQAQQKTPWRMLFQGMELMIHIGDATYMRNDNEWTRMPNTVAATMAGGGRYTECKAVGHESVDGTATDVYEYKSAVKGATGQAARVWIGTSDGLPHRWEVGNKVETFSYKDVKAPR